MKQTTIQISFNTEKLNATKQFMDKKGTVLESELDDFMQKLYMRYVPQAVQNYIETRIDDAPEPPKQPRTRPARTDRQPATAIESPTVNPSSRPDSEPNSE